MNHALRSLSLLALTALPGFSAMRIDQILNNYNPASGPGLPNYAIAQGSIAIVKGLELSDRSTGLQSTYPLPKTLEGVTVEITVGITTLSCILYYVLPQQLAFIVPSGIPVGSGTLRITNNGNVGTAPIAVTKTGFGILTLNGAGTGPVGAFFAGTGNFILNNSAANPDDLVTLFGTGVGPFTGDESILNTAAQDYTSIDTQVLVGSVPAQVLYRGASQFPGLNQINFRVPTGIGFGCYVSLVVITNGVPSNQTTIPVQAKGSRTCSDPPALNYLSNAQLDVIAAKGGATLGSLSVGRNTFTLAGSPTSTGDSATGRFQRLDLSNFNRNAPTNAASFGSCAVTVVPRVAAGVTLPPITFTSLDAGSALTLAGNGASVSLPKGTGSNIFYFSSTGVPASIIGSGSSPSTITITGPGGPDVGALTASTDIPGGFAWSNETAIAASPIDRSKGVTITWTNAPANTFVQITGSSGNAGGTATFICNVASAAGTLTVPPDVLLQLPASLPQNNPSLTVGAYNNRFFTAPPLDYGIISGFVSFARTVAFQ